jgi:hypothetical protein
VGAGPQAAPLRPLPVAGAPVGRVAQESGEAAAGIHSPTSPTSTPAHSPPHAPPSALCQATPCLPSPAPQAHARPTLRRTHRLRPETYRPPRLSAPRSPRVPGSPPPHPDLPPGRPASSPTPLFSAPLAPSPPPPCAPAAPPRRPTHPPPQPFVSPRPPSSRSLVSLCQPPSALFPTPRQPPTHPLPTPSSQPDPPSSRPASFRRCCHGPDVASDLRERHMATEDSWYTRWGSSPSRALRLRTVWFRYGRRAFPRRACFGAD